MPRRLSALALALIALIAIPASAQTAAENFQKAMDLYQANRFSECRDLLLTIERQLGGPKLRTTSFLILSMYKSNAFDSREILSRIETYGKLSQGPDALSAEIKGIESTVKAWKADRDAKIESIAKSRDLNAAREQTNLNYKMVDYNAIHKALHAELSTLHTELGSGTPLEADRTKIAAVKRLAERSAFGLEDAAKARLPYLDNALVRKIAAADYQDTWLAIHRELFGQSANSAVLEKGRLGRLAKEQVKRQQLINRRDQLLAEAQKEEEKAAAASAESMLMLGGMLLCSGLSVYFAKDMIDNGESYVASGDIGIMSVRYLAGLGGILFFGIKNLRPRGLASYHRNKANEYREKANHIYVSAAPTFDLDAEGEYRPGFALAVSFRH